LLVQDSSRIGVDRGNLTINASNAVQMLSNRDTSLRNSSRIFATASEDVTQTAGNLTINTRHLSVQGGAQILTGSSLVGLPNEPSIFNAGETVTRRNLTINASDSVTLSGSSLDEIYPSGLFTTTFEGQDSGKLTINTKILLLEDGAQVATGNFYSGQVGNLTVNATEKVQIIGTSATGKIPPRQQINGVIDEPVLDTSLRAVTSVQGVRIQGTLPSGLFTNTPTTRDVGDININTRQLLVQDGGQISANTFGQVRGSNLNVNATEQVQLVGTATNGIPSGLLTRANPQAQGEAGNLTILTGNLLVQDGAQVSAGNLFVNARSIDLAQKAFISADTRGVNTNSNQPQVNINLRSQDLILLRGNSSITTNARGSNVIGGNITIDTKLLAAFENSDISANSADFRGGQVKITAEGITGTQFRPALTPESDITATGTTPELSGTVEITTPAVDPSRGLTELPENVSDASNQIAQKCRANDALARQPNQFLITGKGGLPANPYDTLESESAIAGWINVNNINNIAKNDINYPKIINSPLNTIVEAQALTFDANGNLVLIAEAPHPTPQNPALIHPVCTS
jgi:large exoprotein involved in heme utilization and adhesion